MDQEHTEQIEKIMADMDCPNDFQCHKIGFEELCKAKDNNMDGYAKCLEKRSHKCQFGVPFGGGMFCRCPLRVYIARNLIK